MFDLRLITMNATNARILSNEVRSKGKTRTQKIANKQAKRSIRKINKAIVQAIKNGEFFTCVDIAKEGEEVHRECLESYFKSKGYMIEINVEREGNCHEFYYYIAIAKVSW